MKSTVLLPLLLLAAPASAREGAIDLGLSAGGTFMDPLEVLGTAPSFTPRVGYWVRDAFLLEADLGFGMGNTSVGTPDPFPYLSLTPRVNAVGRVWADQPVSVAFTAGLGAWYKKVDDGGELALPQGTGGDVDFLANAGPGLMVPLGDALMFRTDLRWMLSLGTENWENHGDAFINWELTGGLSLVLGGAKDTDKDGIVDDLEGTLPDGTSCVDKAEDVDGWQDEDGCPDIDNDGDGILDTDDQCANEPEGEPDGFEDEDGCPDLDDDGDGIPDVDDACRMITGVESANGCPDEDGDGIADGEDECTRDAANDEVGNAFGCPDGDGDGIPDYRDTCPEEPGPKGASPFRSNGCNTRVYPSEEGIVVTEPVAFSGSRGTWKATSNLLVDDISEVIKGVKSFTRLEIRVYADKAGDEAALEVAQRRANKLMDAFVKDGADPARLTAKGVEPPELEGEGPHPNVFVAALEKQEITALKRKYDDEPTKRTGPRGEKKDEGAAEDDKGEGAGREVKGSRQAPTDEGADQGDKDGADSGDEGDADKGEGEGREVKGSRQAPTDDGADKSEKGDADREVTGARQAPKADEGGEKKDGDK